MLLYIVVSLSLVLSECSVSAVCVSLVVSECSACGENVGFVRRPSAQDCDIAHFYECVAQVTDFADGYSFQISSAEQLKESCKTKTKAVDCVKDFIQMHEARRQGSV
ncbi:hypothetical protein JTE90_025278 [Oedothorax gibbosus]|uniref:Uncharacterized protein n=1 Tax=Oedothorax gibbosus TaxID=931172 RepID=A0AAV6TKQ2_9ARAC|nr:hypothetical protein JTE90_025278 [Oedothorax gibbosus]